MRTEDHGIHLHGPARLALVDDALDALDSAWGDAPHIPAEDRTLFTLAVSEVLTNMVQHGDAPTEVTLRVDIVIAEDELRATMSDTAPPAPIDWHGVTMPGADSESGRGLALARAALDEFTHSYDDTGNVWHLRRRLPRGG